MGAPIILVNKNLTTNKVLSANDSLVAFPKEDLVTDSPSNLVRTEFDNLRVIYTFDAGENKTFTVDQFAVTQINYRTGIFQMSNTNVTASWSSPTVNTTFAVKSITTSGVTSISSNILGDTSLSLRLNQLASPNRKKYLVMTSGTANGKIYKIEANTSKKIQTVESTMVADGVAVNDKYQVIQDRVTRQIPETSRRFVRYVIDSQNTPDGYYSTGKIDFGMKWQMSKNFNSAFIKTIVPNINLNIGRSKQKFSFKLGSTQTIYNLAFTRKSSAFTNEVEDFMEAIDYSGSPFIFIPDSSDLQNFILGRLSGEYARDHVVVDIFNIPSIVIEEEL